MAEATQPKKESRQADQDIKRFVEDNKWALDNCIRCKLCTVGDWPDYLPMCPSYRTFKYFAYCGGGRIQTSRGIFRGNAKVDEDLADVEYRCTTCGACVELCPSGQINRLHNGPNAVRLVEMARAELVEKGVGPRPEHRKNVDYLRREYNPYGKPHAERLEWLGRQATGQADVFYFAGCTAAYPMQELAKSTVALLDAAKVKFAMAPDERCCGSFPLRIGQLDIARDLARHNAEQVAASGARVVVTSCPGCSNTLENDYARLGADLGVDVKHITELLADLVRQGKLKFKEYRKTATYHDPCHLGRHMGIYDPPRAILAAIPGLKLVEMKRTREYAWCCGAGGGVKSAYPEWALDTARERIREALETGAEVLVTTCPFCKRNLQDAVDDMRAKLEVVDLVELAAKLVK